MLSADLVSGFATADINHRPLADSAHILFSPNVSVEYAAHGEEVEGHIPVCDVRHSIDANAADLILRPVAYGPAAYEATNRWESTSSGGSGLSWGDATSITWSIVPDGTPIAGYVGEPAGESNLRSFLNEIEGASDSELTDRTWYAKVNSVFERWSEVSGLDFVYEPHDDGAALSDFASVAPGMSGVRGDIRIGGHAIDGPSGKLAYNFFPDNGEMVLDTSDNFFSDTSEDWLSLRNVMAHEVGHGIGLSHVDPVNGTKLMEAIASMDFDGPQSDDILAAHRLYGDMFEKGQGNDGFRNAVNLGALNNQRVTIGDHTRDHYVSIDSDDDVDVFRFTAEAGARLDFQLVPEGTSYRQGAVGSLPRSFVAQAQNDLVVNVYDQNQRLIAHADRGGLGQSEILSDLTLTAAGEYFVQISGHQDAAQLYQFQLTILATASVVDDVSVPTDMIRFDEHSVESYGGVQDRSGAVTVENGGATLRLSGSRWQMIDFPYTVTPHTVLEFDFMSTVEGDIHGIGFDSNTSISSGLTFRLHGSQQWGRGEFAGYEATGSMQHFVIPVGQSYVGKATSLIFVNDHDVSTPNADSVFRNVRVYEAQADQSISSPPRAENDYIVINEDSRTVALNVLANDDAAGRTLRVTDVSRGTAGGSVSIGSDGRIHYRPASDFNGLESFVYRATSASGSTTAKVTVRVQPKYDPPVVRDNVYMVTAGHTYLLDVLNNDLPSVDTRDPLRIVAVRKDSVQGKIAADSRSISYTPPAGFVGTETLTYWVADGVSGHRTQATVTVRVVSPRSTLLAHLLDSQVDSRTNAESAAVVPDTSGEFRFAKK